MQVVLWVLLTAAIVFAKESQDRRSKLPYVADALGNTLPPPSNLPATVGSPVNLLTPDRYEFYTFDESGELVKRLMTLEEIQAIVAAGEDTEGLVTFANDNQPTMAFNFSQPPYTKVHSVVTNVQNVLKAEMEAHKHKPHPHPTLDTPDVSDSWSLILPSIFGNTGVDIVPDKTIGSYITPETETIEIDRPVDNEDLLSKEGSSHILSSPTSATAKNKIGTTTTTSTTTRRSTISTTTLKPTTTKRIVKPLSSTSIFTTTTTTAKPNTISTTTTTTSKPNASPILTHNQSPTHTSIIQSTFAPVSMTTTPVATTKKRFTSTVRPGNTAVINNRIQTLSHISPTTERGDIQYEKISTFIPVSTITYLSESTTKKVTETTKIDTTTIDNIKKSTYSAIDLPTTSLPKFQPTATASNLNDTTQHYMNSPHEQDNEKIYSTTITTQSVSPTSTVTSTEFIPFENSLNQINLNDNQIQDNTNIGNVIKESEPILPLFDVAQSISQIASDLGGVYTPIPTSNNLSESTKINDMDLESKQNLEMDIPSDTQNNNENKVDVNNKTDNFIKITTIDPQHNNKNTTTEENFVKNITNNLNDVHKNILSMSSEVTTMDPVLSESMGDLLSQVVNESPENNLNEEKESETDENTSTTQLVAETTTEYNTEDVEETTEVFVNENQVFMSNDIPSVSSMPQLNDTNQENSIFSENSNSKSQNLSSKIENKQENIVNISVVNSTISPDIESTLSISSTEIIPDLKVIQWNKSEKNETHIKTENQLASKFNKESFYSANSSLPSYKSESDTNETRVLEKNKFLSHQHELVEKKELYAKRPIEKGPELMPKVEEFKKKIQKVNIDDKELESDRNSSWKLIPTVSPTKTHEITKFTKDKSKTDTYYTPEINNDRHIILEFSKENQGLELTTKDLGEDIAQFTELCNELAFRYWNDVAETIDKKRSFIFSPYALTSMLAMMFMGAKGATSGEMNDILKLDDMVTFNPHFTLKNISDSIETSPATGVVVSAFIRELYSDRNKGKILTFYKERAQHFYNGHVEEVNFKLISDIIRRRTNLLVKRYTWGKILEYMKTNTIFLQPPLAAFSANIFQTDCTGTSVDGRDGEMYFVVSPNVRQRRLVPVPAVVYKNNFLAGYDPVLDATAAALGNINAIVSTIFVMPGQQGNIVHAEDLEDLEKRLLDSNPTTPAWNRLLRSLLPRVGLELQIPRFSHKSVFNISSTLKRMGLKDLFDANRADLGGLNGPSKDLYLSDMIQSNAFATCGEGVIGEQHHREQYPELQKRRSARWVTGWDEPRDYQRAFHDPHDVGEAMHLPLHLRPRQARLPARNAQPARLKFDRPFLFFVRHNPSGMILYVGRYNPRLLP